MLGIHMRTQGMQHSSQSQLGPHGMSMQPVLMPAGFLMEEMLLLAMEPGLVPLIGVCVEEEHILLVACELQSC